MRLLMCSMLSGLLLCGTATAESRPQGKSGKHAHQGNAASDHSANTSLSVQVAFGSADVTILRNHYAPQYRNLPPGLQKKVARGGQLPPGWQKKFEPFPADLDRRLSPLPAGYRRGVFEGRAVIFNSHSNVIVDVAVLY